MNKRRKTLAVLTPAFPANEAETSWVTTQQLFVRTLKEQYPDLNIVILSLYYPDQREDYQWREIQVIPFDGTKRRKLKRFFFWRDIWRRLRRIRRENELIGLFSFWCSETALVGSYFGKWHGIAHYCWLCGQDARKQNKLVNFIRPRPQELIAMSDFLVAEFQRNHGIRPGYMIPNAIDPDFFSEPVSSVRDIDVLGAGSLSRLKQYDLFVGVVGKLRDLFPSIRAVQCGEGEDRENIEGLIKKLGLEDRINLMGLTPHREVLALMQRTKVFLHTSNYEGFGVVCLEALYAGAQVISFCKPLAEDIPGWHIVRDSDEMARKAAAILADPSVGYRPVLPYTMADTVKAVGNLFHLSVV